MAALPLRRLLPYLAGTLVVLAVGAWTLHGSGAASGSDGEPALILAPATTIAGGEQPSGGSGPSGLPTGGASSGSSTSITTPPTVFVQIAGAVRRPGVYEVAAGARVFEALLSAGGVSPEGDEQALPLAAPVTDGMRVFVPRKGEGTSGGGDSGGVGVLGGGITVPTPTSVASSGPVSLNTATVAELDELPGIGPATAARIIAYRDANGPFTSVDDLDEVSGIGPATVERLRDLVRP